jgi:hypothetical protein
MRDGTFRMLVLGDSIAWGQGLLEADKYHTLVAEGLSDPVSLRLPATLPCNLNLLRGPNGSNEFGDPQARIKQA